MSAKQPKPNLSHGQVSEVVERLFGLTLSRVRPLPSYDDQNFHVVALADGGGEYVLKVMNSEDSKNEALLDVQTHAMSFLHRRGLPAQTALPTTTGQLMSLEDIDCGFGPQKYIVRLLTYLPGDTISKVPVSPQLLYEVGKVAARMDTILLEMEHPHLAVLQRDKFIWSLSSIPLLEPYLCHMDTDPSIQAVVKAVMEQYNTCVLPKRSSFRQCINHGDFNDLNILVQPTGDDTGGGGYAISGILDFGDMSCGYFVYELAIAVMYMMIESPRPVAVGAPVLAGWESVLPLNAAERDSLYTLVLARFVQSLVMARYAVSLQPQNEEYLMTTAKTGVRILRQLWELGKDEVERLWFQSGAAAPPMR